MFDVYLVGFWCWISLKGLRFDLRVGEFEKVESINETNVSEPQEKETLPFDLKS